MFGRDAMSWLHQVTDLETSETSLGLFTLQMHSASVDVKIEMTECFNLALTATIHQLCVNLSVPFTC